jgi:hypothetical protein
LQTYRYQIVVQYKKCKKGINKISSIGFLRMKKVEKYKIEKKRKRFMNNLTGITNVPVLIIFIFMT